MKWSGWINSIKIKFRDVLDYPEITLVGDDGKKWCLGLISQKYQKVS